MAPAPLLLSRTVVALRRAGSYYSEAHGLVYVVDAADPGRFDEARQTLHELLLHADLAGIPLLVFANKQVRRHQRPLAQFATTHPPRHAQFATPQPRHYTDASPRTPRRQDAPDAVPPHEVQARLGLHRPPAASGSGSSQPQSVVGVAAHSGVGIEEGVRWLVDELKTSPRALALLEGS